MRLLFVTDPAAGLDPRRDSSLALMRAAAARGHDVERCDGPEVFARDGVALAGLAGEDVPLARFDAVWLRVDPPFGPELLALTHVLDLAVEETTVVNAPRGLREAGEKLYACRFPDLAPATVVAAGPARLRAFVAEHGDAVLKPVDGHGGRGVVRVRDGDPLLAATLARMTRGGRRAVVAQEFLPAVSAGDKRILVLAGEPLGAIRRVPRPGEFRANLRLGAVARPAALDDDDERIVARLAPALCRDGLWFAGLDVVDGRLTEVNVVSPTGLVELEATSTARPLDRVLAWLEGARRACLV